MTQAKNVEDALRKAQELLVTAKVGLSMVHGTDPALRPMGIQNVAVFGRSVTLALQNLRTVVGPSFDEWYSPFAETMKASPLFEYFKSLRNEILKEGPPRTSSTAYVAHLDGSDMRRLWANAPPGAKGFFIGDHLGGSGWNIELEDGAIEKFYVQLPPDVAVTVTLHLPDNLMADTPIDELCRQYVDQLSRFVDEAVTHFASSS